MKYIRLALVHFITITLSLSLTSNLHGQDTILAYCMRCPHVCLCPCCVFVSRDCSQKKCLKEVKHVTVAMAHEFDLESCIVVQMNGCNVAPLEESHRYQPTNQLPKAWESFWFGWFLPQKLVSLLPAVY